MSEIMVLNGVCRGRSSCSRTSRPSWAARPGRTCRSGILDLEHARDVRAARRGGVGRRPRQPQRHVRRREARRRGAARRRHDRPLRPHGGPLHRPVHVDGAAARGARSALARTGRGTAVPTEPSRAVSRPLARVAEADPYALAFRPVVVLRASLQLGGAQVGRRSRRADRGWRSRRRPRRARTRAVPSASSPEWASSRCSGSRARRGPGPARCAARAGARQCARLRRSSASTRGGGRGARAGRRRGRADRPRARGAGPGGGSRRAVRGRRRAGRDPGRPGRGERGSISPGCRASDARDRQAARGSGSSGRLTGGDAATRDRLRPASSDSDSAHAVLASRADSAVEPLQPPDAARPRRRREAACLVIAPEGAPALVHALARAGFTRWSPRRRGRRPRRARPHAARRGSSRSPSALPPSRGWSPRRPAARRRAVVVLGSAGTVQEAVDAMQLGAADYLAPARRPRDGPRGSRRSSAPRSRAATAPVPARLLGVVGTSLGDAEAVRLDREDLPLQEQRPAPRRERHGQGAHRARAARARPRPAARSSGQLRHARPRDPRERAVRARARRVHRRERARQGSSSSPTAARSSSTRSARLSLRRRSSSACSSATSSGAWAAPPGEGRPVRRRGDQPRTCGAIASRPLPRGPLLPPQGRDASSPAAARAPRGHPRARGRVHRRLQPPHRRDASGSTPRARAARRARLAGQRARAPQRGRGRVRARVRRHGEARGPR